MSAIILALIVAGLITGATITLRRRPAYRAAARGAWNAGVKQTRKEFRAGYARTRAVYDRTQKQLRKRRTRRARVASFLLGALGVTLVTAGGAVYGAAVTIGATGRVVREATRGGRREYRSYRDAIEVEVVEAEEVVPATPKKPAPGPAPAPAEQPKPETLAEPQASDPAEPAQAPAAPQPPSANPDPGATPDTTTEGTTPMAQTEASGLTSYAQAHAELANELQDMITASQSLAGSMSDVLADHSDLIGDTATLQDLLAQAQSVAQQIADRAAAVASS
ncbi:hypothetical protein ACQPYK_25680 [Streptosporangium sp. CA-135522]|uniref:hypothetical protein n=1 Tax=Streptosporangium sp. CA-135522 TaxID=3240072 RepID=UPI003D9425C1